MVFLGIRPQGGYYWHHLGRETFLAPVRWDAQGWPVVNEGKPIALDMQVHGLPTRAIPAPPVRDDFDGSLGTAWTFLRNPVRTSYSTTERRGWLTLHGTAISLDQDEGPSPTFVGRPHDLRARIATRIDFRPAQEGEESGLVLYRDPRHRFELGVRRAGSGGREVFLRQTVGAFISTVTATAPAPGDAPLVLQIEAEPTRYTFAWGPSPEHLKTIGNAETRLLSTEVTGGFIGTYVGLYALVPSSARSLVPAAFDWFDYDKHE
jgi:xylan 1,4-beta-xylosidase